MCEFRGFGNRAIRVVTFDLNWDFMYASYHFIEYTLDNE